MFQMLGAFSEFELADYSAAHAVAAQPRPRPRQNLGATENPRGHRGGHIEDIAVWRGCAQGGEVARGGNIGGTAGEKSK